MSIVKTDNFPVYLIAIALAYLYNQGAKGILVVPLRKSILGSPTTPGYVLALRMNFGFSG